MGRPERSSRRFDGLRSDILTAGTGTNLTTKKARHVSAPALEFQLRIGQDQVGPKVKVQCACRCNENMQLHMHLLAFMTVPWLLTSA